MSHAFREREMKHLILLLAGALLLPGVLQARTCHSTGSGNWTDGSIWTCLASPSPGDTAVIQAGHTVTITTNIQYSGDPMIVIVEGTWFFQGGGSKITMPCGSGVLIEPGGNVNGNGNGSSQTIRICNITYWSASMGNVSGPAAWPATLPVELLGFEATWNNGLVNLSWSTATEHGSSHFVVVRTDQSGEERTIGFVDAAGNSLQLVHYALTDPAPMPGTNYYHLYQYDADGTGGHLMSAGVQVIPLEKGPFCTGQSVDGGLAVLADDLQVPGLIALDMQGRSHSLAVSGDRIVDVAHLPAGIYLLREQGPFGRSCRFLRP